MTAVEELDTPAEISFESIYTADRGTLYRALVMATGNRDIAVEAVDRAFAKWQSRRESRRDDATLQVFSAAYAWAARKVRRPGRMIQGFRLVSPDAEETDDALLGHFDELDLVDRSLLTCVYYLGWDTNRAAAAVGVAAGEALPRSRAAESRLARSAGLTVEAAGARLPGALSSRADTLLEPLQRTEQVKARARWRRIGLFASGTAAALVLVAGVGYGVQAIVNDSPEPNGGTGTAEGGPDGTTAKTVGIFASQELIWERVPVPIREGDVNSVTFGPAGFVAVGQEWSGGNNSSLSLVSEDGVFWEVGPGPAEGPNAYVNQMVLAGDKYIAIGNSFNEFVGTDVPFLSISDDGVSWSMVELPIEPQIELNGNMVNLHTYVQSVAASGDRVIVMAQQNAEFDVEPLIRAALPDVTLNSWGWSDRGVEIYNDNGQLEQTISWEEIGVDAETVAFINSGRPVMYASTDLTTWETLPLPGFGPNGWVNNLTAVGDSFAAIVYGDFGSALWVSEDGAEWTKEDNAFGAGVSINSLAGIGDNVIAVGNDVDGQSAAWMSTDLKTWEPIVIPLQNGWLQRVQVSSAGIGVLAEENQGQAGPVDIIVGDLTVRAFNTGGFAVLDADGVEIAKIAGQDAVYGDGGTTELLDPETGETLVEFDQRELEQAWEVAWRQIEQERGNSGPSFTLLVSETGEEWTSFSLADVTGGGFYPNGIAVGPDSIVMTGYQEGGFVEGVVGGFGGGSGITVWVGTAP